MMKLSLPVLALLMLSGHAAVAEEGTPPAPAKPAAGGDGASTHDVDQANNPLALLMSVNIHAYMSPGLTGLPDSSATNSFLRLSLPFWRILPRVSLPIGNLSSPGSSITGVGDLQAFAVGILTPPKSPLSVGVGPLYVAPTAADPALGTGKHQLGGALVAVYNTPGLLTGTLVQYQHSFAGDAARPDAEVLTAQLFVIAQIGAGYYVRSTPQATFNLAANTYNLPVGIGAGKVFKLGRVVMNFFIEPQYVILANGIGQPTFQIFSGVNGQFPLN